MIWRLTSITDYAKTKKALDTCPFCYQDDAPPKASIVAMGHRTYLACTQNEELVDGHCLIVPLQHHLSMLEMDDDDWDEVRVSIGSFRFDMVSHRFPPSELHEVLDANVRQGKQRRLIFRNRD
jgi:hypothetical protein